jgi:hypothetical protein
MSYALRQIGYQGPLREDGRNVRDWLRYRRTDEIEYISDGYVQSMSQRRAGVRRRAGGCTSVQYHVA